MRTTYFKTCLQKTMDGTCRISALVWVLYTRSGYQGQETGLPKSCQILPTNMARMRNKAHFQKSFLCALPKSPQRKGPGNTSVARTLRIEGMSAQGTDAVAFRTRSGTCRTRRDQCCSGLPAGCSSRQRSCSRCRTQGRPHPAR